MKAARRARWWVRAVPAAIFWYLAYIYLTLPDVRPLARENPDDTAFMRLRAEQARAAGETYKPLYRWVPYSRISGNLKRAVLVAEDSAFWQHEGIDLEQIRESMEINLEHMEFARGASTITQQLAKNLYLSPSKNPIRKVRELLITRRLEAVLTKRRILEIYLNVIEWGDGVWGAEAAARAHFGKSAAALSADESALLAGAIINPRVLDPGHPNARLRARARLILRRIGRATPPPDPQSVSIPSPTPFPPPGVTDGVPPAEPPATPTPLPGPVPSPPTPTPAPTPTPEPQPSCPKPPC